MPGQPAGVYKPEHRYNQVMSARDEGPVNRRWLNLADPKWRAQLEAVTRGELRFGARKPPVHEPTWAELPARKKRMTVICNHGVARGTAEDIGGLTRDRIYASEGEGSFAREGHTARMPCATCRRVWLVPHAELLKLARARGPRPGRTTVDRVPGVSLEEVSDTE
jgi:hypothetical protein